MEVKVKILGFTLIEMVIVMCISAIVLTGVFSAFLFFEEEWAQYYDAQTKINELLFFKSAIDKDLETCDYVKADGEKTFLFVNSTDTVKYLFGSNVVRIQKEHADTFKVKFNSDIETCYIKLSDSNYVVSSITIGNSKVLGLEKVIFHKPYSCSELLKTIIDNLH